MTKAIWKSKSLASSRALFRAAKELLIAGPKGEADVVVVLLGIVFFSCAAVEVDVKYIGIILKEVARAVSEMRIHIDDEKALKSHLPKSQDGDGHVVEVAKAPAASP